MPKFTRADINSGFDIKFMNHAQSKSSSSINIVLGTIIILLVVFLVWWLGLEKAAKYSGSRFY